MNLLLIIVVLILLFGVGGGYYGYHSGYYGTCGFGGIGLILLIIVLVLLFGGGRSGKSGRDPARRGDTRRAAYRRVGQLKETANATHHQGQTYPFQNGKDLWPKEGGAGAVCVEERWQDPRDRRELSAAQLHGRLRKGDTIRMQADCDRMLRARRIS